MPQLALPMMLAAAPANVAAAVLLAVVLLVAAVCDWRTSRVPNALTYPAILLGLVFAVGVGWWQGGSGGAVAELSVTLFAIGLAIVPFVLIFAMGGLGGGDVKLMVALGALSGDWRVVFATMVYAFVIGAVMALTIVASRGLMRQTMHRVATAAFFGGSAAREPPAAPGEKLEGGEVPFAVAIAIGGIVAALELLIGIQTPWAAFVG